MSVKSKRIDLSELDLNMSKENAAADALQWLSPLKSPFHIAGFYWLEQDGMYRRLPLKSEYPLPDAVDTLAYCTAGGQIRFRTNSSKLFIKASLAGPGNMYHMPSSGQCGFDCYLGEQGSQQFVATTRFNQTDTEYVAKLYEWGAKREYNVTLNFPLYQGVEEIWIGVDEDADVSEPPPYVNDKPVVIYGTSVTQGGCASRPGMAYSNIISRSIPQQFINLGFSGNGKGEPELAHIMASINNPALYVLDYEGNTGQAENIAHTLPAFIRILRERHPDVPILVVSRIRYANDRFYKDKQELCDRRRQVQLEHVEQLRAAGDRNIHFIDGYTLLSEDEANECTVDGKHPSDLGFMRIARSLEPAVRKLLKL